MEQGEPLPKPSISHWIYFYEATLDSYERYRLDPDKALRTMAAMALEDSLMIARRIDREILPNADDSE